MKCLVYSGTPLMWGPDEVSCIERCSHFSGKFLLRKRIWYMYIAKCSQYRGVLILGVSIKRGSTVATRVLSGSGQIQFGSLRSIL